MRSRLRFLESAINVTVNCRFFARKIILSGFAILLLSAAPATAYAEVLNVIAKPMASDISYGQTLGQSVIDPSTALVQNLEGATANGAWAWQDPGITVNRVGSFQSTAIFNSASGTAIVPLSIQVTPAPPPEVKMATAGIAAVSPNTYVVDIDTGTTALDVLLESSGLVLGDASFGYKVSVKRADPDFLEAFDITGGTLAYGVTQPFTIGFLPNDGIRDKYAELVFTFSQVSFNYSSVPEPITLQIHQSVDPNLAAAMILSNIEEHASSELNFPQIEIAGATARLIYNIFDIPVQLTVPDISQLQADEPYPLNQLASGETSTKNFTKMLPEIVVNDILAKKADSLVETAGEILIVQSGEELTTYTVKMIPARPLGFPTGVSFGLEDFSFTLNSPNELLITADIQTVRAYVGNGFDYPLPVDLYYNGIEASQKLQTVIQFSNSNAFASSAEADLNMLEDTGAQASAVELALSQIYDPLSRRYITYTKAGHAVHSTVPNGLVTNGTASIDADNTVRLVLYKDDEKIEYYPGREISEPGSYRMEISDMLSSADARDIDALNIDESQLETMSESDVTGSGLSVPVKVENPFGDITATPKDKVLRFRILGKEVRGLKFYNAPPGFTISQVVYNDENIVPSDRENRAYPLTKDGFYAFLLISDTDSQQISVKFNLDNTPALIKLEGITDFIGTSPVRLHSIESSTETDVRIDVGGSAIPRDNTYSQYGIYEVYARDPAGNSTKYAFQILYSMNLSGYSVFLLSFVSIGGLTGYLIYLRKNIRVR